MKTEEHGEYFTFHAAMPGSWYFIPYLKPLNLAHGDLKDQTWRF